MNIMKLLQSITVIAVLLSSSIASAQWWGKGKTVKGNGEVTTITRNVSDYDKMALSGFMDFELVKGTEGKIIIEGESNLLDDIITEVKDDKLKIKIKDNTNLKPSKNKKIVITIPFNDISAVALAGSGDVNSEAVIKADDFKVALAGSGDIVLNVDTNNVQGAVAGSGDITLKGKTDNLKANVAGSGNFHGFNLEATNVEANVSGSGDVDVTCNGALKARVSGSGDVGYKGSPTTTDTKVAGSRDITKK